MSYAVGVIALDGAPGARLVATIVDTDPDTVTIGMPLTVGWDDIHDRTTIPRLCEGHLRRDEQP